MKERVASLIVSEFMPFFRAVGSLPQPDDGVAVTLEIVARRVREMGTFMMMGIVQKKDTGA